MRAVLASNNAGKLRELGALLTPLGISLDPQAALGVEEPEETGLTFVENALLKARHAAQRTGLPAIADDSGLVVPALGGAPGIYSARYGGEPANDRANCERLIAELDGQRERRAHFYCALVWMRHARDPAPLIATGRWLGSIVDEPRGSGGFGYDPHFEVAGLSKTAAELDGETKNRLSHRGQAVRRLLALLEEDDGA
jgi:XTP/dITP diphosphohydrolase